MATIQTKASLDVGDDTAFSLVALCLILTFSARLVFIMWQQSIVLWSLSTKTSGPLEWSDSLFIQNYWRLVLWSDRPISPVRRCPAPCRLPGFMWADGLVHLRLWSRSPCACQSWYLHLGRRWSVHRVLDDCDAAPALHSNEDEHHKHRVTSLSIWQQLLLGLQLLRTAVNSILSLSVSLELKANFPKSFMKCSLTLFCAFF